MARKEPPQIDDQLLVPLLELNEIEKGRKIYKTNDQSKVHWQLNSFIIQGIDNSKEVLLVKDTLDKLHAIPFDSLGDYVAMKYGFNNQLLWNIDFEILKKGAKLDRKRKYDLYEFSREMPQGMVSWLKVKNRVIWISGPKQFHDWAKKEPEDYLKMIFKNCNRFDSQQFAFDLEKREMMVKFREKIYTIAQWIQKLNL